MEMSSVVRLVDDFKDDNFSTRDSCPGNVFGHELIPIGRQIERRFLRKHKIKHLIFLEKGTRNIWYKNSYCDPGVVAMGFSISKLDMHPKAVSMEVYSEIFLDGLDKLVIPVGMSAREWMKQNDFELVEKK